MIVSDHGLWPLTARVVVIVVLGVLVWGLLLGVAAAVLRNVPACWL